MWFEDLTGFQEVSPEQVRKYLSLEGKTLTSSVNGKQYNCGTLETSSLASLRTQIHALKIPQGKMTVCEVIADVQDLHKDKALHD